MVERSLSMREAPGSIPGLSSTALRVGGLYSSVGQSARLVSARSGVRTSLEASFWDEREFCYFLNEKNYHHHLGSDAAFAEPGSSWIEHETFRSSV
jgi:hypothetical protein